MVLRKITVPRENLRLNKQPDMIEDIPTGQKAPPDFGDGALRIILDDIRKWVEEHPEEAGPEGS